MRRSSSALRSLALRSRSNFSLSVVASLIACLILIVSPLPAQQTPALVTQRVDNTVRTVLTGNVHPLARAAYDQGEVPADLMLHRMLLVLKRSPQQETALRNLIENQQYKKSSSYHQWLTPVAFGSQFGPADSDIAAVTSWLQASGFQIAGVNNGRTVIEFSGTAGQVKLAFGTAIHTYVVNGEQHLANSSDPSIPTALVPVVAGINSLHNFFKKAQNIHVGAYSEKNKQLTSKAPNITYAGGCSETGAAGDCYGLGPYDFANIYDVLPLWTATTPINGTGQTIAIVGRTDINPDDAPSFWSQFGLGTNGVPMPTLTITYNGPNPGVNGDEAEADIDTQWSGAVAPGATINFVTSESTETDDGVDLSALYIVDNNVAPIMSESYGSCEAGIGNGGIDFYNTMWEQAAAQGITVIVSTGDNGAAGCDDPDVNSPAQYGLNVNGLASTWSNVAVGGTDFNQYNKWSTYWNTTNAATTYQSVKNNTYIPETSWNDSCTNAIWVTLGWGATPEAVCNNSQLDDVTPAGGAGGASAAVKKPSWQTGTGVPNDTARDLPDVSLFASNGFLGSFYLICQSDASLTGTCDVTNPNSTLQGYGGTSVAAPAFAGIMALVNQKAGSAVGNPNYVLYKLQPLQSTAFHDVPSGSTNAMPCVKGSPNCVTNVGTDAVGILSGYNTTTAYDLVTGLGSVDANILVTNWNKVTFTPTTTTLTLTVPASTTHGASIPVSVAVTPSAATGDVAILVAPGTPGNPGIDGFTLSGGTASGSTNLLPGGTYKVIAHYEGDGTYGGSYSSPSSSITINPEASSVYMPGLVTNSGTSTSVVYGTGGTVAYWLRADVFNSQGNYCNPPAFTSPPFIACPTGTIDFTDNGNALDGGTFKLNSLGYTEDQSIQLTGGSHTLKAVYSGDASYKTSNVSTVVTVTTAPTAINNLVAPATANTGAQFAVSATVTTTSYGVAPTGTVKFYASGTLLTGTVQLTPTNGNANTPVYASLAAALNTSIATAGTYAITAVYSGDTNYATTTSGPASIVVSTLTPDFTIAVNATPSSTLVNQNVVWSGTLTAVNGYNKSVALTCTAGAPSTCNFTPPSVTPTAGGASFMVTVGSGTAATYNFNIQGTDGTLTHQQSVTLTVNQDFSVPPTLATPATANPGQTTSTTMALAPVGAGTFGNTVTYACSGLPTGATCSFAPPQIAAGGSAQSVTVTVQTAGPFTGTAGGARHANGNERPKLRSQNQRLWLPLSLPLAGILLVGLAGGLPRRYKILGLCLALTLAGLLVACGGGSSAPPIVVSVSPPTVNTLYPNLTEAPAQTQQFSATLTNTTNQTVTWAVSGTGNGTIDPTSGLYTAPATLPNPNSAITITATSAADGTKSGTGTVNLQTPTPAGTSTVTVTVTEGSIQHTTTFSLIVAN
jgi:hypothetical protein